MTTVPTGVLEAAVYVEDLDAAESFYSGVVGLETLLRVDGRHVFFRCGTTVLLCFVAAATKAGPSEDTLPVPAHGACGACHVCFAVNGENLDELVAMLTSHGIEIEADFRWPNGARSVYVRDPDGNSVEFAEAKLWGFET